MTGVRLNLGGAINPIDGFVNLDKTTGWTFESGLSDYAAGSVEAITVSHVLMYVKAEKWAAVFAEFHRVLEPGGIVRVTEDAIGAPGSSRPAIRTRAAVATSAEMVADFMRGAGLEPIAVSPDETRFVDRSLIQRNYGEPPDVFHLEGVKP